MDRRDFLKKSTATIGGFLGVITPVRFGLLLAAEPSLISQKPSDDLVARLSNIRSQHPSLHFNVEILERLRRRAKGTHRRYAEMLFGWVDRNRTWSPSDMPYPSGREVALEQTAAFITNAALAFALSRQDEYLQLCRKWISEALEYPTDEVRNYGFGIYAAGLARAYDWLYHYLPPGQRERIRTRVADVVGKLYEGSVPADSAELWWANAHMHHDHWIPVGGYGEAALALLGEVEQAGRWAAAAKTCFDFALSWFGDDGAWHEGAADWCYALAPLLWFYGAWQSVVGENLHDVPWIRNTAAYRLYHWLGSRKAGSLQDDSYVYLNDSFRSGRYNTSGSASCHLLRRLASLFRDGHAQWLADRDEAFDMKPGPKGVYQAPYENLSYTGRPKEYPHTQSQCVAWNLLWYDPAVKPIAPAELPRGRHFRNQGVVIMRTGWANDATVVSLACAPLAGQRCSERIRLGEQISSSNYSHAHADYSAFTLFARGQYFIVPPGYARRSSGFQNVVSVNGADFLVNPSINVRVVGFRIEKGFSYAVADATEAFPHRLGVQRYRRHIVLLDCGPMLLFDDLQLTDVGKKTRHYNSFNWTVHSDPATHQLSISPSEAIWKTRSDEKITLTMQLLEPQELAWEHALLQSPHGKGMLQALRLKRSEWYTGRMRLLSVWSWQDRPETPTLLRHSDFLAVLWKDSAKPAVGFAISEGVRSDLSGPELRGRELLLFGHDPAQPDCFISIKDGKALPR